MTHQQRISSEEMRAYALERLASVPHTPEEIARRLGVPFHRVTALAQHPEESDYLYTRLIDLLTPFVVAPLTDGYIAFRKRP